MRAELWIAYDFERASALVFTINNDINNSKSISWTQLST